MKHRRRARTGFEPYFDRAIAHVHFQYADSLYVAGETASARAQWRLAWPEANPAVRCKILVRIAKSYLPRPILNSLRTVAKAGRELFGGLLAGRNLPQPRAKTAG